MTQKTRFVPAKDESTGFIYPKRGTQRERSPSPCGGVRVTPSPERLARPSGVEVPPNTDLTVFKKPIPGRIWDDDRRKRNELLSAYSFGQDRAIAAQLRRLISEMKVFAEEAKKNVSHSRGVGIEVQGKVRDPWPFARFDGWLSTGKKHEMQRKGLEGMYLDAHFDRKLSKKERNQRILAQRYGPIVGLAPVKETNLANEGAKKMPLRCEKKKNEWMIVENGKPVPAKALKIVAETIITPIGYSPIKTVSKPALRSAQPYLAESIKKMETSYAFVNKKTVTGGSANSEKCLPWITSNAWAGINCAEKEFENLPTKLFAKKVFVSKTLVEEKNWHNYVNEKKLCMHQIHQLSLPVSPMPTFFHESLSKVIALSQSKHLLPKIDEKSLNVTFDGMKSAQKLKTYCDVIFGIQKPQLTNIFIPSQKKITEEKTNENPFKKVESIIPSLVHKPKSLCNKSKMSNLQKQNLKNDLKVSTNHTRSTGRSSPKEDNSLFCKNKFSILSEKAKPNSFFVANERRNVLRSSAKLKITKDKPKTFNGSIKMISFIPNLKYGIFAKQTPDRSWQSDLIRAVLLMKDYVFRGNKHSLVFLKRLIKEMFQCNRTEWKLNGTLPTKDNLASLINQRGGGRTEDENRQKQQQHHLSNQSGEKMLLNTRGGGNQQESNESSSFEVNKEIQHDFLLRKFNQCPNDREQAYTAIRVEFGDAVVDRKQLYRWWTNFVRGTSSIRPIGRPPSSTESDTPRSSRHRLISGRSTTTSDDIFYDANSMRSVDSISDEGTSNDIETNETEDPTEQNHYFGMTQDQMKDLGISAAKRDLTQFKIGDKCAFEKCSNNVNEEIGFAILDCGHKCHWEYEYATWTFRGLYMRCPNKRCKKVPFIKCSCCKKKIGYGLYECGCYCTMQAQDMDIHADKLEKILTDNNGKCQRSGCGVQHPGFCNLCKKLFVLSPSGGQQQKIYLQCCKSYCHHICWQNSALKNSCPNGCSLFWNGVKEINFRPYCVIATTNVTAVGVKPRGIIGGRPRSDDQLKSPRLSSRISNASIDSILMPPPSSLAPRRSSRVRRTPSTLSHQSLSMTPSHTPITNQCVNVAQTTHFGLGCAAKSSKHMPKYYNTLGKGKSKCPHCAALLFNSKATGSAAFSKCCAKGRVDLPARYTALQERPACYEALFNNKDSMTLRKQKHLMEHVLAYNNTLSFGHVITQRSEEEFFRIVKCNNMIQYVLWDYNPPDGSLPLLHGQLFTIPPTQAHERLGEIAEQFELNGDLLYELHGMLRNLHPMAKLYETAAETFNQQPADERVNLRMLVVGTNKRGQERTLKEDEAQPIDVQLPPDHMLKQIHPGRLQVETEAGSHLVAQFFVDSGQNVLPNMDYEVVLFGRQGTGQLHLKWWRREIDPANFPLMFPKGQFGFEDGLPLKMKEGEKFDPKQNVISIKDDNKALDDKDELGEDEEFLGVYERVFRPRDRVSRNQFFRYMAQIRSTDFCVGHHWLWQWGKLAQLHSITANNRMEAERVQYMKRLLGKKKLITPASIMNMLEKYRDGQGLTGEIGRVIMTDEHFRGSRQFYQKEFANCMTICREIGKPDLLITLTMDPECQEFALLLPKDNNGQQQQWYD